MVKAQRVSTYQTRIAVYEGRDRAEGDAALSAYGELYGRVQRKLFADVVAGGSAASLKSDYIKKHGIPARMFNGVRVLLEGKVASVRESQRLQQDSLQRRIDRAQRQVSDAAEHGRWDQVHQKKRRLANLRHRLVGLEGDIAAGLVRLCFGSKRLWRKQHHLEANGYGSHEEWLSEWRDARSDEFFVLGSRDETAGCQLCVASVADDGRLTLRLRMPDCLANQHGKYLVIEGVRFAYGHEQVLAALASNADYVAYRREHGEKAARATDLGQAISYRFKRDGKGWRVFVSTQMMDVPVVTDRKRGTIGVDLNADHLAVAETDASGNWLCSWRVPLVTYGTSRHQAEALIGDAVAGVVRYAQEAGKPIVIEKLDFRQKKAALEGEYRRYSRMLSSFSYGKIKAYFISRGYRQGVEIHQVNPAFSSIVGRVKFMERYGLTVHQAAALGAGPTFARLFRAHPAPVGLSRRQWRAGRLHRTREEAREARVDVLGCGIGAAETGACSAAPAGEAETQTQSGSGCRAWSNTRGGLSGDQLGVPGCDSRAESPCTVGAAARLRPRLQERLTAVL